MSSTQTGLAQSDKRSSATALCLASLAHSQSLGDTVSHDRSQVCSSNTTLPDVLPCSIGTPSS